MPNKRLLARLAVVAGLGLGGLAGFAFGVPTVAGAQTSTTTVPPTGDPVPGDPVPGDPVPGDPVPGDPVPGDQAPDTPGAPDRPGRGESCPDKGGESDGSGSSTLGSADGAAIFRGGPGARGGAVTHL